MAPVLLKYVVSFSSQDSRHPVENLLNSEGCKKWLCAFGEKSGRLEAEFQMERACTISHLDIGAEFVFSVQILVGRSSWPAGKEYVALLLSATFMSPADCRTGKNKSCVRMFKKEDFDAAAASEKWDRIRIVCCQPLRKDVQYGLSLLRVLSDEEKDASSSSDKERISGNSPRLRCGTEDVLDVSPKSTNQMSSISSASPFGRTQCKASPGLKALGIVDGHYSRAGQLLMAATGKTVQYKPPSTKLPTKSPETVQKKGTEKMASLKRAKPVKDEIRDFVNAIDYEKLDLETFTFKDLRHQFEKQKFRKLSTEERKFFFSVATEAVEAFASSTATPKVTADKTDNRVRPNSVDYVNVQEKNTKSSSLICSEEVNRDKSLPRKQGAVVSGVTPFVSDVGKRMLSGGVCSPFDDAVADASNGRVTDGKKFLSQSKRTLTLGDGPDSCITIKESREKLSDGNLRLTKKSPSVVSNQQSKKDQDDGKSHEKNMFNRSRSELDTTDGVWLSKSTAASPGTLSRLGDSSRNSDVFYAGKTAGFSSGRKRPRFDGEPERCCNSESSLSSTVRVDQFSAGGYDGVECPLCLKTFPSDRIVAHASGCSL